MYEEYLEDYVYKLMSKFASKMCYMFKPKKISEKSKCKTISTSGNLKAIDNVKEKSEETVSKSKEDVKEPNSQIKVPVQESEKKKEEMKEDEKECDVIEEIPKIDEDLNNLNFHMMLFFLWICVTIVNLPPLLTWARNFK